MVADTSEIDTEIQEVETELSRQVLNCRLRIAGLSVILLIIIVAGSALIISNPFAIPNPSENQIAIFSVEATAVFFGGFLALLLRSDLYAQRDTLVQLRVNLGRLRSKRKNILAGSARTRLGILIRYKNDLPELVDDFRLIARKYGRVHNLLQVIVIGGSLSISSLTAAFGSTSWGRGLTVAGTLIVSASAAYAGYYKLKEKSLNLQHTADEIEREHRAVELRIGDYEGKSNEEALSEFVAKVEALRANQHRQQLELDQPADVGYRVAMTPDQDQ